MHGWRGAVAAGAGAMFRLSAALATIATLCFWPPLRVIPCTADSIFFISLTAWVVPINVLGCKRIENYDAATAAAAVAAARSLYG